MYLKNIVYKNVGVLSEIKINPSFMADNLPKPIIIVGENGSGKSTFLSNIVDSFYEIAGTFEGRRRAFEHGGRRSRDR